MPRDDWAKDRANRIARAARAESELSEWRGHYHKLKKARSGKIGKKRERQIRQQMALDAAIHKRMCDPS